MMAINLVCVNRRCIWGSQVQYHKISLQPPQWGMGPTYTSYCKENAENQNQDEKFILFPPKFDSKQVETSSGISEKTLCGAFHHNYVTNLITNSSPRIHVSSAGK